MNKQEHYEIIKRGIIHMLRYQAFTDDEEMSLVLSFIKSYGLIRDDAVLPGSAVVYGKSINDGTPTLLEEKVLENVDYVFNYFY